MPRTSRASDRKDNTPQLRQEPAPSIHEMSAITPPIFFPSSSPKNRLPYFRARTCSLPEIVSDQISGDGAWMNFRFSPPKFRSNSNDLNAFLFQRQLRSHLPKAELFHDETTRLLHEVV